MRALVPVVAVIFPLAASAQVKLEVTPYFTSYYATALTAKPAPDTTERQEAGPGLGALVTYRFNNILGVQASYTYVWSGIIPKYPAGVGLVSNTLQALPGRIAFTTLRATVQPRRSNYFVAAGLGIVQRSGKAWDVPGLDHLSSTVASLGFGIRTRVTPSFGINIGLDGNFYYMDPDGDEQAGGVGHYYQKRMQRDVLVSIGVPYGLIGK